MTTTDDAREQLAIIHERAANDASLTYEQIKTHCETLLALSKAYLLALARCVCVHPTASMSKRQLVNAINDSIASRKMRSERTKV